MRSITGSLETSKVLSTTAHLAVFLVAALVLGLLAVPRLLGYVARFKSNEVLLITVLGLCLGVSLLAVKLNYSVALGAFLIGAVIAEARELGRIEILTEPIRDMFSAVFFVAMGMLIDPKLLLEYAWPITVITIVVVIGKVLTCSFGTFVAGHDTRTAVRVGMGLAQIGEFSFIIASLGRDLRVTSEFLYPIAVTVSAITTFLTPFLIKRSDSLVRWFDHAAPRPFVNYLALYTRWVGDWRQGRHPSLTSRLIRRWAWQIGLNLMLVAGIFIATAFLRREQPAWLPSLPGGDEVANAAYWVGAVLVVLPLLIATYRKLQALGLLLGEMAAERLKNEPRTAGGVQAIIANTIPVAGIIGMALLLLVLSAALLPSWRILIVLLLILAGITTLLWRHFVRVYSKAQIALVETFAQPPPERHPEPPSQLAGLLKEAELEQVVVAPDSPCHGKLIRELALRTLTGASIVAIERAGAYTVNPGPDDELLAGDQVLLLGKGAQLEAARRCLLGHPPDEAPAGEESPAARSNPNP